VIEDLDPKVDASDKHDHIYDNFPKGKLCKNDGCPEKKQEESAAPTSSATLSEGTSSQEKTVGRQFIRNESLTGDVKEISSDVNV